MIHYPCSISFICLFSPCRLAQSSHISLNTGAKEATMDRAISPYLRAAQEQERVALLASHISTACSVYKNLCLVGVVWSRRLAAKCGDTAHMMPGGPYVIVRLSPSCHKHQYRPFGASHHTLIIKAPIIRPATSPDTTINHQYLFSHSLQCGTKVPAAMQQGIFVLAY